MDKFKGNLGKAFWLCPDEPRQRFPKGVSLNFSWHFHRHRRHGRRCHHRSLERRMRFAEYKCFICLFIVLASLSQRTTECYPLCDRATYRSRLHFEKFAKRRIKHHSVLEWKIRKQEIFSFWFHLFGDVMSYDAVVAVESFFNAWFSLKQASIPFERLRFRWGPTESLPWRCHSPAGHSIEMKTSILLSSKRMSSFIA